MFKVGDNSASKMDFWCLLRGMCAFVQLSSPSLKMLIFSYLDVGFNTFEHLQMLIFSYWDVAFNTFGHNSYH